MKKFFESQSAVKLLSVLYLVVMVLMSYEVFKGYVDPEFPYFASVAHTNYATIVAAWVLVFLLCNGVNTPDALNLSIIWISIIGVTMSCFFDCCGIWLMLVFFVGSLLLGGWKMAVNEKEGVQLQ